MKTIKVITLGCSKNTVDTEHLLAQLPSDTFRILDEESEGHVDTLLVNTCGFIGDAKEQSIELILKAVAAKNAGDVDELVVFGCLSQRYAKELPVEIPEVDAWFGARDLAPVLKYLGVEARPFVTRYVDGKGLPYAYLKVSEGCDRRCSYCAIPHIRGPHRSVPMEDILAEAHCLAARGVRELILIAQDTTYYGLDIYRRRALAELIRKLSKIEGIEWIRIHYSYPDDFPEDVIEEMAVNPKVCKYLDIPLQHISDKVLSNMHRHVTSAWTRDLVARMRSRIPGVVLRTTVIVGHPGEEEADFEELMEFVREARFERLGAFQYSEEEGTWGAAHLVDDVPAEVKAARYDTLMAGQASISLAFNESRIGTVPLVLVERLRDNGDCTVLVCRSEYESPEVDGEILVTVPQKEVGKYPVGSFIRVRIVDADEYDLYAVPEN
ncbi:MAG: 30S ribosomal protein S12 methylthiotransferase RimO [Bacteroidales bacterium]|nr:30S ribosomal protein S12 methylthiotransferase RimO [Bacteroidales bacterium]